MCLILITLNNSSHSSQILNQVTPNPCEVKVQTATQNKNMNRSMNFLPRK